MAPKIPEVPSLAQAIARVMDVMLQRSTDHWIRIDIPADWPLPGAIAQIAQRGKKIRVGVLEPFEKSQFAGTGATISASAQYITKEWRNQGAKSKRDSLTVVAGPAQGEDEAGLEKVPFVAHEADVLDEWETELVAWIAENVNPTAPRELVRALLNDVRAGVIDAVALDSYLASALKKADTDVSHLKSELWRLGLFPDARVLDGQSGTRLEENFNLKRLLLSRGSDSASDRSRLQRLRDAAAAGSDIAKKVLAFDKTGDPKHLRGVDLDAVDEILRGPKKSKKKPPTGQPPLITSPDRLLDLTEGLDAAIIRQLFEDLASAWILNTAGDLVLNGQVTTAEGDAYDVQITVNPTDLEEGNWIGDGSSAEQRVAFFVDPERSQDWLPVPKEGYTAEALERMADAQDKLLGRSVFVPLVQAYVAARAELQYLERWLRRSGLPLMLFNQGARDSVRRFLDAWKALTRAALDLRVEDTAPIKAILPSLEAMWGGNADTNTFSWCVLGPFHPYILSPLLQVADFVHAELGKRKVGEKLTWALDRALPAYRAIWAASGTLFLSQIDEVYVFENTPKAYRPHARSGDGISQVVDSFLGYHPYATDTLVITLIDPPKGGAVAANLRRIQERVRDLRVYLVTTGHDVTHLEELGDLVRNLGRFDSLQDWLQSGPVKSHLTIYFAERGAGSEATAQHGWGPTPGTNVALKIGYRPTSAFNPEQLTPYVTLEPREGNSPAVVIQALAAPNLGAPKLVELQPMLRDEEVAQFAQLAMTSEWVVIAAPAPLGLIAPRAMTQQLTYLGRESVGVYGLFCYTQHMFAVRKRVTQGLKLAPVVPNARDVEDRIAELAVYSPNGVLRVGRASGGLWENLGLINATDVAKAGA